MTFGRILVTGGGGFIGSYLVEQLREEDQVVRVLEKPGVSVAHLPEEGVEIAFADIREPAAVEQASRDCDLVIHLAANPNLWACDPDEFEQVNHQGTRNVLEAARTCGAHRVVHVSTESILVKARGSAVIDEQTRSSLDDMIGPYCRSKWLAEQAARQAAETDQSVVIVNPTIPVGPGDRHLGPLSRMICDFLNGRIKGHLAGELNLIDVRDVAAGIWAAARSGEVGRRYLLAAENWTILELLTFLSSVTGRPVPRWCTPYALAYSFAHLEEWFCRYVSGKIPMATVTGVRLTQRNFKFNGEQSAKELGLSPMRSCRDTIVESIDWFQSSGHVRA